jgi:uncharacterized CHY-type Zn-finger protein
VLRVRCVTSACDSTHIQTPEMLLYGEAYEKCSKSHLTASRNLLAGSLRGYGFMSFFKDAKHLFVFAGLFVLAFLVFLVVRHYVVPKSFGEYGHYRGASIGEIAARPIKFAGHQACESCHSDVLDVKSKGKHAHVNCEACHGALEKHADDPSAMTPVLPDTAVLCARCHTASAAKPKGFPQVVPADHSTGLPCETCHKPHSPAMDAGGAK